MHIQNPQLKGFHISFVCFVFPKWLDTMGLHRVENPSMVDGAVSLHLYCPPYSSCSMFHLKTGKQTKCNVEFYSKFGHRRIKVRNNSRKIISDTKKLLQIAFANGFLFVSQNVEEAAPAGN